MDTVYTVDQIRRAEQPLLENQTTPDELMRSAASGVAAAARVMLQRPPVLPRYRKILLAVGAGGNGGDALYAGAELLAGGWEVDAVLFGTDRRTGEPRVHERALAAFTDAGGTVVDLAHVWPRPPAYRLIVDGILGMGGAGGVDTEPAVLFAFAANWYIPVLSVDVPSGIDADTGAAPAPLTLTDADRPVDPDAGSRWPEGMPVIDNERVAAHAVADVTVTFGGLRRAHAVSAWCGQVVVTDPAVSGGADGSDGAGSRSIEGELEKVWWKDIGPKTSPGQGRGMRVTTSLAYLPRRADSPAGGLEESGPYDFGDSGLTPVRVSRYGRPQQPGPYDDKYSGGVVGICAGSDAFPGAGILATTAAVRTTSSMVRYVADGGTHGVAADVVRACPEVVVSASVAETGRVQAWVVGPGRGTGEEAVAELETLLQRREPLLVDADAITLLAEHGHLRDLLVARSDGGLDDPTTLLTPHAGEFRRLAAAVGSQIPDPDADRIGAAVAMAEALHCGLLLKGRHTVIVDRPLTYRRGGDARLADFDVHTIDAGTSWGATPGSGDVLSGLTGAMMAQSQAELGSADHTAPSAVALHGAAAGLAAQVGGEESDRYVPTSASAVAEAVPRAWAAAGTPIGSRRRRL